MIRYNVTTTSMILTGCVVHNSIRSDNINKTTISMILTVCIIHNSIQSDSIKKP